jgi:hypothetical protein
MPPAGQVHDHVRDGRLALPILFARIYSKSLLKAVLLPFAQPGLFQQSRKMNSPQSPCAFDEPLSAVVRLCASSVSCWFSPPSVPISVSSLVTPVAGVVLRLLHLLAELLDLLLERRQQRSQLLLAALREAFRLLLQNVASQRLELVRQRSAWPFPAAPAFPANFSFRFRAWSPVHRWSSRTDSPARS